MASIDLDALEAQMKQSSLDHLRGYAQDHFGVVKQYRETDYVPKSQAGGYQVLREPLWNRGKNWLNYSALSIPASELPQPDRLLLIAI